MMTEATRAAYWAKIEEIDRKIDELDTERRSLQLSEEDTLWYRENSTVDPKLREITERQFAASAKAEAESHSRLIHDLDAAKSDAANGYQWPAKLRIKIMPVSRSSAAAIRLALPDAQGYFNPHAL